MSFGTYMLITDLSCSLKYDILMSFDGLGQSFFFCFLSCSIFFHIQLSAPFPAPLLLCTFVSVI